MSSIRKVQARYKKASAQADAARRTLDGTGGKLTMKNTTTRPVARIHPMIQSFVDSGLISNSVGEHVTEIVQRARDLKMNWRKWKDPILDQHFIFGWFGEQKQGYNESHYFSPARSLYHEKIKRVGFHCSVPIDSDMSLLEYGRGEEFYRAIQIVDAATQIGFRFGINPYPDEKVVATVHDVLIEELGIDS